MNQLCNFRDPCIDGKTLPGRICILRDELEKHHEELCESKRQRIDAADEEPFDLTFVMLRKTHKVLELEITILLEELDEGSFLHDPD